MVLRRLRFSWIGGSLLYYDKGHNNTPVRFGNAIQLWHGGSNIVVESNEISDVYDTGVTPQGFELDINQLPITKPFSDIFFYNNLISRTEWCFEYWSGDQDHFDKITSQTGNIVFNYNTCVDSGMSWSHTQRPDPDSASDIMLWRNIGKTKMDISYNVMSGSSLYSVNLAQYNTNTYGFGFQFLSMNQNLHYVAPDVTPGAKLAQLYNSPTDGQANQFSLTSSSDYQNAWWDPYKLRLDSDSLFLDPKFIDDKNYFLSSVSPALNGGSSQSSNVCIPSELSTVSGNGGVTLYCLNNASIDSTFKSDQGPAWGRHVLP